MPDKVIVQEQDPWKDDNEHLAVTMFLPTDQLRIFEPEPGMVHLLIKNYGSINYVIAQLERVRLSLQQIERDQTAFLRSTTHTNEKP